MFYVSHQTTDSPFGLMGSENAGGYKETIYACERVEYHMGHSVVLWGDERTGIIATLGHGQVYVMNADGKTIAKMMQLSGHEPAQAVGAISIEAAAARLNS